MSAVIFLNAIIFNMNAVIVLSVAIFNMHAVTFLNVGFPILSGHTNFKQKITRKALIIMAAKSTDSYRACTNTDCISRMLCTSSGSVFGEFRK